MKQTTFGTTRDGREVLAFTLGGEDSHVTILNYGGTVQSLVIPDRHGVPVDIVLGYPDMAGYEDNGGYLGALIGRFGNRIGKGKLQIDGKDYSLFCNDRGNHLHGGKVGFDKKIWGHRVEGETLVLTYLSPDGEENYPGNLSVEVRYSFEEGMLRIAYRAETDKTTAINLTNHTYFNLGGEGSGDVHDHVLHLDCDMITPTNDTMIPEGGYRMVKDTPFDFNVPKPIGRDIADKDGDLKRGNGYDHCHVLKNKRGDFVRFGGAFCPRTGIRMSCATDMPAVQFYSGNGLHQEGKGGYYGKHAGFCLETQNIPNNVNVPEYAQRGSSILRPGEVFRSCTAYRFGS